jgi:tyrosyl-tRNA synthetase
MLSFDSVKLRLEREQPLSFLEFNYMILQAYDFLELALRHDCRLQMGGSDQWGNIVNGTELGRRVANKELFGLTAPLITTSSGAKMGKTAAGAVWLNPSRHESPTTIGSSGATPRTRCRRACSAVHRCRSHEIGRRSRPAGQELNEAK